MYSYSDNMMNNEVNNLGFHVYVKPVKEKIINNDFIKTCFERKELLCVIKSNNTNVTFKYPELLVSFGEELTKSIERLWIHYEPEQNIYPTDRIIESVIKQELMYYYKAVLSHLNINQKDIDCIVLSLEH